MVLQFYKHLGLISFFSALTLSTLVKAGPVLYGGIGIQPGLGAGAPGAPVWDYGAPGLGAQPGLGWGAPGVQDYGYPGVGVQPGAGVGVPGPGVAVPRPYYYPGSYYDYATSYPPPVYTAPPTYSVPPTYSAPTGGMVLVAAGETYAIYRGADGTTYYMMKSESGQWVTVSSPPLVY